MAILSANPDAGRERFVNALDGFKREYTRRWIVESDTADESEVAVSTAAGIPNLGTAHPFDDRAYAITKRAAQSTKGERKKWMVEVRYSTLSREAGKRLQNAPINRPYEVSWTTQQFQRVAEKDILGKAILNSAGQYFDPPIEITDSRPVLTITRNEASFDGSIAQLYVNAINTDVFFGAAAFTVRCINISARRVIEEYTDSTGASQEFEYWQVTYEFEYRRETWKLDILDQGRSRKTATGELEPIPEHDAAGNEIPETQVADPVNLDGAGVDIATPTIDNAVYLTKRVYRELAFAAFGF